MVDNSSQNVIAATDEDLSNKGTQIGLSEFIKYKEDFDPTRTISYSSSDLYQKRLAEKSKQETDALVYGGAAAGLAALLYKKAANDAGVTDLLSRAPGARLMQQKLSKQFLDNQALNIIAGAIDPRMASQPLSTSLQSILMSLEEMSPAQILRTLQLSSFNSLFVETIDQINQQRHIQYSSISAYNNYYKNLIFKESNISLTDDDLMHGFVLHKNKLYQGVLDEATGEVSKGRVLLNYATAVHTNVKSAESRSVNRVFEKFINSYDTKLTKEMMDQEPIAILGSSSKATARSNWLKAYGRFSLEIGAKSLDNPLGFLEEYINLTGTSDSSFVNSDMFQTFKKFTNFKLGTGGVYDTSAADMMKRMGKNLAVKGGIAYVAYQGAEAVLDAITPDSSVWSNGIVAGLADTMGKAHIKFASLWSDNFQDLKKSQEQAAPETTSLSTLMGVPLAGAMIGANYTFFRRQFDIMNNGLENTAIKYAEKSIADGWRGRVLDLVGKNTESNIITKNAKVGAIIGAAMVLPFLPGALVGKSSQELKDEYSGKTEVAVRRDRGWIGGGTAYEGGQIKYHRKSLINVLSSDARTKTLYGDRENKRRLDPIFNPIKYLQNPYKFEEMHTQDMPMPVWGMDVSYGSFLGQMYKGTIGQVIKPTVVHPEVIQLQKDIKALDVKGSAKDKVKELVAGKNNKGKVVVKDGEGDNGRINLDSDAYSTPENERKEVKSLISDGLMLRKNAPTVEMYQRAFAGTYSSLSDFVGIKGFAGNLLFDAFSINPTEQLRPELEVSGSSTNFSETLDDTQLGDMLGFGEFLRRFVPQSSATKRDTVNPMRNQMAPDWLPQNETKYYQNFARGNYYKNEMGTILNPGSKGFETLNPELKGINPNEYPLVYQYKILQNIARGSSEHIAVRDYLTEHLDDLSADERDIFFEAYGQDKARDVEKQFFEYKTEDEKSKMGLLGLAQNAIWESFSHKENPLEPLLPFRPMAKFVHQRTAEEDYIKTQLMGSDVGIWTNPYSHFIKPAANRVRDLDIGQFKPEEALEKERVDTYFDKLGLVKAIRNNSAYDMQRNITAMSYLGVNTASDINRFKNALPEGQSAYVESFSKEKDVKKRERILSMLPSDVGRVYQSIWQNIDVYDKAVATGQDPRKLLEEEYIRDTKKLQDIMKIKLTRDEKQTIHDMVSTSQTNSDKDRMEQIEAAKVIRMKAAQQEAQEYLEHRGGMPSEKWVGWDPRLTTRDIKLKTLMVGKADIHRFGFWDKDQEKVERMLVLDNEKEITHNLQKIMAEKTANTHREYAIRRKLREAGFETSTIRSTPSSSNRLRIINNEG